MLVVALGNVGFGLVWGWLIITWGRDIVHLLRTAFVLSGVTLLLAFEVLILTFLWGLVLFLGMIILGLLLHLWWIHELQVRFISPT